jgi:hypothetical protein
MSVEMRIEAERMQAQLAFRDSNLEGVAFTRLWLESLRELAFDFLGKGKV